MSIVSRCLLLLFITVGAAACVPKNMHVDAGLDPRHADSDVRFRTTYYFRTFDFCWDANAGTGLRGQEVNYQDIIPETDTLYRYRVTGKASALFSNIRFESGVLHKDQIDPFGSSILFDKKNNRFNIGSESPTSARAVSSAGVASSSVYGNNNTVTIDVDKETDITPSSDGICKIGEEVKKGFQIMGPEGIKTFDQDERLIIAMSSSADPLIDQMQKYSSRILNAQDDVLAQMIALSEEESKITQMRLEIADQRRARLADETTIFAEAIKDLGGTDGGDK